MTRPGSRLRRFAARICSAPALERFVDPAIADLQHEHREAVRGDRRWRARWTHVAGSIRILQVVAISAVIRVEGEAASVTRAAMLGAATTTAVTVCLTALMLSHYGNLLTSPQRWLIMSTALAPAAIPIALPMGLGFGIVALGRRKNETSTRRRVLVLAASCAAVMFVTVGWITPSTNDQFRRETATAYGIPTSDLRPGTAESTVAELLRDTDTTREQEDTGVYRRSVQLHSRFAVPLSCIVFALFALSLRTSHPRMLTAVASGAFIALYSVTPEWLRVFDQAPGLVVAWLPNLAVCAIGLVASRRTIATTPMPEYRRP